jgi:hypothetical protein
LVEQAESSDYLALALNEKFKELIRKERLTIELFEILDSRMNWLIRFCQKNGIPMPDAERIGADESRIKALMTQIAEEHSFKEKLLVPTQLETTPPKRLCPPPTERSRTSRHLVHFPDGGE